MIPSTRELHAGLAMQTLMQLQPEADPAEIARAAYVQADAMAARAGASIAPPPEEWGGIPAAWHPMQPIVPVRRDAQSAPELRFSCNRIVRYLLDNGGIDLNQLAELPFSVRDREQFAQLIGYSLNGFCELPFVSDATRAIVEDVLRA